MLVTARARVRRNETPSKLSVPKSFLSEHPFPSVAVLKHRLRRVPVQELAEEIGGAAEVEDVLAELQSESPWRGTSKSLSLRVLLFPLRRRSRGGGGQATASDARRVAWSCGCQAGASSQTRACPRGHGLRGVLELEPRMHGGQSARFDVLPVEVSTPARTRSWEVTGDARGRCQGD